MISAFIRRPTITRPLSEVCSLADTRRLYTDDGDILLLVQKFSPRSSGLSRQAWRVFRPPLGRSTYVNLRLAAHASVGFGIV